MSSGTSSNFSIGAFPSQLTDWQKSLLGIPAAPSSSEALAMDDRDDSSHAPGLSQSGSASVSIKDRSTDEKSKALSGRVDASPDLPRETLRVKALADIQKIAVFARTTPYETAGKVLDCVGLELDRLWFDEIERGGFSEKENPVQNKDLRLVINIFKRYCPSLQNTRDRVVLSMVDSVFNGGRIFDLRKD